MSDPHDASGERDAPRDVPDRLAAIAAMYDRSDEISEAAVQKATRKLAENGDLDPETREAIEALADRLTDQLLAPPAASIVAAADDETVATTLELFGPEGERSDESADAESEETESDTPAARAGD